MNRIHDLEMAIDSQDFKRIEVLFNEIDGRGETVEPWQNALGLYRNFWTCQIAHQVRNGIQSALNDYFGHNHLSGATYQATALYSLNGLQSLIQAVKSLRYDLNKVHNSVLTILEL